MFKKIRFLTYNQVQKSLDNSQINDEHNSIEFKAMKKLLSQLSTCKKDVLKTLKISLQEHKSVIKMIKLLITIHYLIRKSMDKDLIDFIRENLSIPQKCAVKNVKRESLNNKKKKQNIQNQYIEKNLINNYIMYIHKFIDCLQSYKLAKKSQVKPIEKMQEQYHLKMLNHGFQVLNLINTIISSQTTFNQIGRYYPSYFEVMNLYQMYLQDIITYNSYVKKLAQFLLEKDQENYTQQQVLHHYHFIIEVQKTSDYLYQYFYNRYWVSKIIKNITIPQFLNISYEKQHMLRKRIKKIYPNLILKIYERKNYVKNLEKQPATTNTNPENHNRNYIQLGAMQVSTPYEINQTDYI